MGSNSITEGSITKQLLMFFFPIWIGTIFQQLYNTMDAVIVGKFVGTVALAAVGGPTSTIINLFLGFFVGLASGMGVIVAQYYGGRNTECTSRAIHSAMGIAIVGSVFMTFIGMGCSPYLLRLIGTPDDVLSHATRYIVIFFAGIFPNIIYNVGSAILRAMGDSKRPLYFLIVCSIANITLDLLFVVVFKMGVAGAAVATVIAQCISAVLTFMALKSLPGDLKFYFRKVKYDKPMVSQMFALGIPAAVQSTLYSVSNVVIQSGINSFGTEVVAAWTAFDKIDAFYWATNNSFGVALTNFVGQNFGAKKYDRMKKSVRIAMIIMFFITLFISVGARWAAPFLYSCFTSEPAVIEWGVKILNFIAPCYFGFICIEMISGAVRGAGDAFKPTIITCVGICLMRVLWVEFAVPLRHEVMTVCFSYPLTWTITSIVFVIYYIRGNWLKRKIGEEDYLRFWKNKPVAS